MVVHLLALPLLLAGFAQHARPAVETARPLRLVYVFELAGAPVGTLELSVEEGRYTYRSRHLFTREDDVTERRRTARFQLDARGHVSGTERVPDALALVRPPREKGCIDTLDELSRKPQRVCFTRVEGGRVEGVSAGMPFVAEYAQGRLSTLTLGPARFRVHEGPVDLARRDVLAEGLPISGAGSRLSLEPGRTVTCEAPRLAVPREQAETLAADVHGAFASKKPSRWDFDAEELLEQPSAGCLGHVKRYLRLAGEGRAVAVFGLYAAPGSTRAYPHTWIRVTTKGGLLELDPTSLDPVTPATHLPLGCADDTGAPAVGRLWLDTLFGAAKVVRR